MDSYSAVGSEVGTEEEGGGVLLLEDDQKDGLLYDMSERAFTLQSSVVSTAASDQSKPKPPRRSITK
jgi:hypothetical protein